MKVRYVIPMVHRGLAPGSVNFTIDQRRYRFRCEKGRVTFVEVEVPSFPLEALPSVVVDDARGALTGISIKDDPVWPSVENDLTIMEGIMAMYGLETINFEEREIQWVAESDAEDAMLGLRSFRRSVHAPEDEMPVAFDMFVRALIAAPQLRSFELALDFYRRGRADLIRRWYIDAFYDFYFVLETLFAGGAFKSKEVKARMLKNDGFVQCLANSIQELGKERQFLEAVEKSGRFNYVDASVEAVVDHLIATRGYLHHHFSSNRDIWSPRKQGGFRADAAFLATVCLNLLSSESLAVMFSDSVATRFNAVEVRDDEGRRVRFVDASI